MPFIPGTFVKILRCKEMPCLVGRIAKVEYNQDCPGKVRVSYDEIWQGYHKEYNLIEVDRNDF